MSVWGLSVKRSLQFFSAKLVTKIVHCGSLCFYASSNIASQGHKTAQKTKRHPIASQYRFLLLFNPILDQTKREGFFLQKNLTGEYPDSNFPHLVKYH